MTGNRTQDMDSSSVTPRKIKNETGETKFSLSLDFDGGGLSMVRSYDPTVAFSLRRLFGFGIGEVEEVGLGPGPTSLPGPVLQSLGPNSPV